MSGYPMRIDRPGAPADPTWLALREPADAVARAGDLPDEVRRWLPADQTVIHDLGAGTGALGRWLAPRLPGRQRWVLTDRNPALLAVAAGAPPQRAADGAGVSVVTRCGDLTGLRPVDLAGAHLITASALLDLLTAGELATLVDQWRPLGCPALFTLSVTGRVEFAPADPLDAEFGAAFNDHQRRTTHARALLGPCAPELAADLFARAGATVLSRPSPWRLRGPAFRDLIERWLRGWLAAAVEQRPELARMAGGYLRLRQSQAAAGELTVLVAHEDVLACPG